MFEYNEQMITVDVTAHKSDREIRATLLHEMAHAADTSKSGYSHGDGFFEQIEHLLRQAAPITLGMAEMPGHKFPLSAVPEKFPLCRQAAAKQEAKRTALVNRMIRAHPNIPTHEITDEDILHQFEDSASELTWRQAKCAIGTEYGLIDVEYRPNSAWAARLLKQAKRRHARARHSYLAYEHLRRQRLGGTSNLFCEEADLGEVRKIGHVSITWETACPKAFALQISCNGQDWSGIDIKADSKNGISDVRFKQVEARHFRVCGAKQRSQSGWMIRKLEVLD